MDKKTLLLSTALLALSVPTFAQDNPALDAMSAEELLPLAQAEGTVTVYAFTSRIAAVETAFEAAYPGIDMVSHDMSSTEQITRLKAEAAAGIASADVVYISDAPVVFAELLGPGFITPYVPPRVDSLLDENEKSPLLAQRLSTKVLMYNEEANPDGAPVDNLWALTTADWTGRVIMVDPLQRGDYLDLMTEIVLRSDEMASAYEAEFGQPIALDDGIENAGQQFIVDLFENDLIPVSSTDDVNAAVGALGQDNPPVGFTSYSDRRDNEDEGWALQVANAVTPSNGIIFPAVLAVSSYGVVSDGNRGWMIDPAKRNTGLVFQSYALWPHMTVSGNVDWPLKVAGLSKPERQARVGEVLRLLGIEALAARYPNEISGGQQQRVAMPA